MKSPHPLICRVLLTLFFCTAAFRATCAEPTDEQTAELNAYYNSCVHQLHDPVVLAMCDTLEMRARQVGNTHYIALATLTKLDHYYFKKDRDKTLEYVQIAKQVCRKYNETNYYYFVLGSRLVMFYLVNGMPNYALYEAQNMLREAQNEESQIGMIECCKAMAQIYKHQSNPELSISYFRKLIDLVEEYDPEDVNLPIYYSSMAESQMTSGKYNEAAQSLDKVEAYFSKQDTITPYQRLSIDRSRMQLALKNKDLQEAQRYFERIEQAFARNKTLAIQKSLLNRVRIDYFFGNKQYAQALAIIDSIRNTAPSAEMRTFLFARKAEICWDMNDRATAATYLRYYIDLTDSVRQQSVQNSANEIAGLLNLQQLEKEKQQLQVDIQHRRLTTTYWALGFLVLALIAGTITVIRLIRLNRQLKEARRVVLLRNHELQVATAKAEQANELKSRFIQDISHEVRTPLNAIVGFSEVLGDLCDQPEAREYASIIATNSDNLLRLFNDVLELSSLDQLKKLNYNVTEEINASSRTAINEVMPLVKKGVELSFRSSEEGLQVLTNPTYVTRMLGSMLHNAAKFTESGRIQLECIVSRQERTIRYSVTDTGPGIPSAQQDMIFERFKKLDNFSQGSGLGLPLCRTIAEKLGGSLEIDRSYTQGSRFVLTLPLAIPGEQAA